MYSLFAQFTVKTIIIDELFFPLELIVLEVDTVGLFQVILTQITHSQQYQVYTICGIIYCILPSI